ncbi:ATP-dependent DNA helicase PcrA [Zhongshania aliphaticivorans]|uniref:DNA 3'-5' helicase n=1 Tax=Zhongshania aliphaticivorans TaxID=1470434 RepID=A0A5S9P5M4_9GAMM|nr:ATP-dependent helicase [Zhongshania aliphaticivorans]CAA0091418.1 ATP-dependent DNA helicase PcrA [Zhongshania aliphaticivorans]CAA0098803.1 ATP-dependent DNA helicase PcrA [Zhongshania aliphaticivorans]
MLTEEQLTVTRHLRGHARVTAVAGAGKTTTMVRYVLERVKSGMDPRLVRVVMFNKAAQEDFSRQLRQAAGTSQNLPPVRTFHAMGRNLAIALVKEGYLPQFDPNPLGDAQAGIEMLKALQASAGTSAQRSAIRDEQQQWLDAFAGFVDLAKSTLKSPESSFLTAGYPEQYHLFIEAFERFEQWRKSAAKVTFSDFLYDPCKAIAANPKLAQFLANRVELFVVDEFQDINDIQFFLLKTLAGERARLQVVGDADQCIYEFRGARPEYMLTHFGDSYPHSSYKMSRTFRYGHSLALAAAQLISQNQRRDPVLCISGENAPKTRLELKEQTADGYSLAEVCLAEYKQGRAYSDMVFLCRTWAQAAPVELVLLQRGIPNRIAGGSRVLERHEIRVLLVLLKLMAGQFYQQTRQDCEQQVFELLRFCELKIKHEVLRRYATRVMAEERGFTALGLSDDSLSIYQEQRLQRVASALTKMLASPSAGEGITLFLQDLDLLQAIRDNALSSEEGENRAATIVAFVGFVAMQTEQSPAAILAMIEGLRIADGDRIYGASLPDAVTITTMHRSKGLEWPVVIIPGLSAHYMPYQAGKRRRANEEQQESERRLMYVAMTRAINVLYLFAPGINCRNGWDGGLRPELNLLPSPFVTEMNVPLSSELGALLDQGLEYVKDTPLVLSQTAARYLDVLDVECMGNVVEVNSFVFAALVEHSVHGRGRIITVDDHGLEVQFSAKRVYFSSLLVCEVLTLVDEVDETSSRNELSGVAASEMTQGAFALGETLAHSKYGRGIVVDVDSRFIHLRFRDGVKTFRKDLFRATRVG